MSVPRPTGVTVDAHHHLWDPDQGDYPWMTGRFAPLRRKYAAEQLIPELTAYGVHATVVVQVRADEAETRDLLALTTRHCFLAGVVGWVDLASAQVARQIEALRSGPGGQRLVAVRHDASAEPDPQWLLRADVQRGLADIADAGLAFDLEVTPRELAAAVQVAGAHPDLRFVLDHLGKPPIAAGGSELWRRGFAQLASLGNVWCKLSGLVTEANWDRWTDADLAPYIREAVEQFGIPRLLFGSDWPVCELAASYGQVLAAVRHGLPSLDPSQTARVFGLNAVEVYRLDLPRSVNPADQPEEAPMGSVSATTRQQELQARALRALAGGVSSNTRLLNPHLIMERASGSRIWDADGKEYIDYLLGQGPNFLGYAPPRVLEKVLAAQRDGIIYAATHTREIEAAERVLSVLGWAETMRFGSSSTEMVQAALRMARAATGRAGIVRFHGHYHGWIDNIYTRNEGTEAAPASEGQPASALTDVIPLEWNDIQVFEQVMAEHGSEVAAVLMEPIMINAGVIPPDPGYLEAVRRVCQQHGTVLIFDETISGFRVALGGAAERYGVHPDLAVYGKAMAAGWPCAAIAGRRDLFADVAAGRATHAGTFNGNTIATAAVLASIDELASGEVYEQVGKIGTALMDSIRDCADASQLELHVQGLPMAFHASFAAPRQPMTRYRDLDRTDPARYARLADTLIGHGVWVARRGIWYVSAAHTEADVSETLNRLEPAFRAFSEQA